MSNDPFITITSGSSGTGNGKVDYTVPGNTNTTALTGTMTIAGQTFTVNQAAGGCTFKLSPKDGETQGHRRFGDREGEAQPQRLRVDRRQQRFVYHHHGRRQWHGQGNGHLHGSGQRDHHRSHRLDHRRRPNVHRHTGRHKVNGNSRLCLQPQLGKQFHALDRRWVRQEIVRGVLTRVRLTEHIPIAGRTVNP